MHKTLTLVGLGAVGVFALSKVVAARGGGLNQGVAKPIPPSSPSLLDTLVADAKKGIAAESVVAGSLTKLGLIGGTVSAPALVAPVATLGIDAATAAALPGATAIGATPGALEAAATSALETGSESAGLGLGITATLALVAIPFALFALAAYFGKPCPQTQAVYDALSRAIAACGSQNPGTYGADVANWLSYKGPGYLLFLNKNF